MTGAKIQLSTQEIGLVTDGAWILTKNSIVERVIALFAALSEEKRTRMAGLEAVAGVEGPSPKISRGENYLGLPYVMLDYPRVFGREDVLAIRTMFWWGNSISITLHLKGRYQQLFLPVVKARQARLAQAGFHIGISEDEWRHEHTKEVYQPLEEGADWEKSRVFLKLSAAISLDRINEAPVWLSEKYEKLIGVLLEED